MRDDQRKDAKSLFATRLSRIRAIFRKQGLRQENVTTWALGGSMFGQARAFAPIRSLQFSLPAVRLIARAAAFVGLMFFQIPALHAQSSLYTDQFGNTTGTIGNNSVNTYHDQFGDTTGTIGNRSVNTYSDRFGNTTGTIGNRSVNTYSDQFGNTTGTIGNDSVNLYTDHFGNTTGTIGGRSVSCYTDRFGNSTCN